ncbi:hypothetical protein ACTI_13680 [Actinoplanes sp. OR16]|uniref:hypothetical protein n=1 Tax=Actinoplanes sp. OR16 TaxID=946334 RepID=UPI000F6C34C9|nr:hypothetical protein [Actinoplanes sp. OR16]BBH64683.1 hypothetical protein ACTI_13680 [Actinoplanes sp. OR16]
MNRRDVLTNFREGGARQNRGPGMPRTDRPGVKPPAADIELDPADHEEPTWEVHRPGAPRRRFDKRARAILTAAAVAALLANAGAAWAYWRFNGPDDQQPAAVTTGTAFEMALSGSSDPEHSLRAGTAGNLTVTVTNQHPVPIRITAVQPLAGTAVADDEHREAGCAATRVEISRRVFAVSWEVPKNTVGAFVLPDALSMRAGGPASCRGATFTVPMRAQAVRP